MLALSPMLIGKPFNPHNYLEKQIQSIFSFIDEKNQSLGKELAEGEQAGQQ